jgi:hypothetical protein
MAVLSNDDYRKIREYFYRKGFGKEEFKALVGGLPSSTNIRAAFQKLEDSMTTDTIPQAAVGLTIFQALKTAFENTLGVTISNALFNHCFRAWINWKLS